MLLLRALTTIEGAAYAVLLPLLLLSLLVSGLIVVSGWQRRQDLLARQRRRGLTPQFELAQTPFVSGLIDVAAEVAAVLRQFEGRAAARLVALEMAVQPGLTVRVDPGAFRAVLSDLLDSAIAQGGGGRVLLGASRIGNRVRISVSDDSDRVDGPARRASLRDAERLAAMHGAMVQVDARPTGGTTVAYLLPVHDGARRTWTGSEPADPISVWAPAHSDLERQRATH
jgi:hypothetical protein